MGLFSSNSNDKNHIAHLEAELSEIKKDKETRENLYKVQIEELTQEFNSKEEAYKLNIAQLKNTTTDKEALNNLQAQVVELEKSIKTKEELYNAKLKELEEAKNEAEQKLKQTSSSENLEQSEQSPTSKDDKKIKKLKDEIENLEDEIDDKDKEIEEQKQKCKNLNAKIEDLKSQFEDDTKKIKEKLKAQEETLEIENGKVALHEKSLTFVRSILDAKVSNDSDHLGNYAKIDNIVSYLQGDLRDAMISILDLAKKMERIDNQAHSEMKEFFNTLLSTDLFYWAAVKKKSWIDNKAAIAFVGEFSAGKTSIVNRMLSQDNPNVIQLPVSAKATTAIPTYISGGKSAQYRFFTPDNMLKMMSKEQFENLDHSILKNIGSVKSLISYLVLTYDNENLSNLSILDTPGFSNNAEDSTRTIEVINECDALFWVFDVNNGTVNRESIKIIRENLQKPLYIVINKIDSKSTSEVDAVERLIKETFIKEKVKVEKFIRFSANKDKCQLSTIMNTIKSIASNKHVVRYEDAVMHEVNGVIEFIDAAYKAVQQLCREAEKKQDKAEEKISQYINSIQNDCNVAEGIPNYHCFMLTGEYYDMSTDEYKKLTNILNRLSTNRVYQLIDAIDSFSKRCSQTTSSSIKLEEVKQYRKEITRHQTKVKELFKNLNKAQ